MHEFDDETFALAWRAIQHRTEDLPLAVEALSDMLIESQILRGEPARQLAEGLADIAAAPTECHITRLLSVLIDCGMGERVGRALEQTIALNTSVRAKH